MSNVIAEQALHPIDVVKPRRGSWFNVIREYLKSQITSISVDWRVSAPELDGTFKSAGRQDATPTLAPISSPAPAERRTAEKGSYRLLSQDDVEAVVSHYQSLSLGDRRYRFHVGMSDVGVSRYVSGIDWTKRLMVAYAFGQEIEVILEMAPHSVQGWKQTELATSIPMSRLAPQVQAELLQVALFHARDLSCSILELPDDCVAILQRSGAVTFAASIARRADDTVLVELDDWFQCAA